MDSDTVLHIDEAWIREWVRMGLRSLESYLARHAEFDAYCRAHQRPATGNKRS
jgi:hypothetical protein